MRRSPSFLEGWDAKDEWDRQLALTQLVLKFALAVFGWHSFLTMPPTFQADGTLTDITDSTGYPHTALVFFLFVAVTIVDMVWHLRGDIKEKIHHVVTLSGFVCAWYASDLTRTMACYNGIAETVAPFYQLLKLGYRPTMMRFGAILTNILVRLPFFAYTLYRTVSHMWWSYHGQFYPGQMVWPIWMLWALSSFVYVWLDYGWTGSMIRTLRRQMDGTSPRANTHFTPEHQNLEHQSLDNQNSRHASEQGIRRRRAE